MATYHVEARGIQLHRREKAPLVVGRALRPLPGHEAARGIAMVLAQVVDDGEAFGKRQIAIDQHRDLLARVDGGEARGLGLTGPGPDRLDGVFEPDFGRRPMGPDRPAGANPPDRPRRHRHRPRPDASAPILTALPLTHQFFADALNFHLRRDPRRTTEGG